MINTNQLLKKWFVHLRLLRIRGEISIMGTGYKKIFLTVASISLSVIIIVLQPFVVIGLQAFEVSEIAKKVTVSIEGPIPGSGVMVGKNKNTYQVMTTWHVVEGKGKYSIQTFDDKSYPLIVNTIQRMPNIDLAIIEFTSETPYLVATVGDSNRLKEGMTVFVAGYPTTGSFDLGRNYTFLRCEITTLLKKARNGYSLGYDNFAIDAMSGGAVLNEDGKLVAIHGAAEIRTLTGASGNYGIASKTFIDWQEQVTIASQKNISSEVFTDNTYIPETQNANVVIKPNIKFNWPTIGTVNSNFGWRSHPLTRNRKFHSGIDIGNLIGTPINASADGVVISAGWSGDSGKLVILQHPDGTLTYYGHNSTIEVEVGKKVFQGEQIALMGSTGRSTSSHLHFEIRASLSDQNLNPIPINPIPLLRLNKPRNTPYLISYYKD
jgi:murein DD-endopeptidase MepM/ murein hydrolase activator NlpD